MMFLKSTNALVHSPDGHIDFFDIVTGVLQGDTYMFTIWLEYIL